MQIEIKQPEGPYSCTVDTGVMDVSITEAFVGAAFITETGEKLSVCMRDNGFEVRYSADFGGTGFDTGWTEFKNGTITHGHKRLVDL